MDDQTLQRIANVAQIIAVLWVLFVGSKTLIDLAKGIVNIRKVNLIIAGICLLTVVFIIGYYIHFSTGIHPVWYQVLTISAIAICIHILIALAANIRNIYVHSSIPGVKKTWANGRSSIIGLFLFYTSVLICSFIGAFFGYNLVSAISHTESFYINTLVALTAAVFLTFLNNAISSLRFFYSIDTGWFPLTIYLVIIVFVTWSLFYTPFLTLNFTWYYIIVISMVIAIFAWTLAGVSTIRGIYIILASLVGAFIGKILINYLYIHGFYVIISTVFICAYTSIAIYQSFMIYRDAIKARELEDEEKWDQILELLGEVLLSQDKGSDDTNE